MFIYLFFCQAISGKDTIFCATYNKKDGKHVNQIFKFPNFVIPLFA